MPNTNQIAYSKPIPTVTFGLEGDTVRVHVNGLAGVRPAEIDWDLHSARHAHDVLERLIATLEERKIAADHLELLIHMLEELDTISVRETAALQWAIAQLTQEASNG